MPRKHQRCCNPFQTKENHFARTEKDVRPITNDTRIWGEIINPNFQWTTELHICSYCRLRVLNEYRKLQQMDAGELNIYL